jgi:hypothetical protein
MIAEERNAQEVADSKGFYSVNCSDPETPSESCLPILLEETGEVARAINDMNDATSDEEWQAARENLRLELVQVAAVACAWIEALIDESEYVGS